LSDPVAGHLHRGAYSADPARRAQRRLSDSPQPTGERAGRGASAHPGRAGGPGDAAVRHERLRRTDPAHDAGRGDGVLGGRRDLDPKTECPMNRLLAAIPFVFPIFVAAQDSVGSVKDDPPRITPEMKAKTETIARALEGLTPEGFTKKGLVERYTEANLYEKINGRSELFHSYDVTGMTFVTFSKADDPAKFIDVFLYDMTTPLRAFGVYSVERSPGSKAIATGGGGHRTGADLFFRKGQYYASILTSRPDDEVQAPASAFADTLAHCLKGEAAEVWGLGMLPAKNRVDDTVQYLMVDALGLDFLTNAFKAQYRDGDSEFTAFVARCKSAANAAEVLAKYKAHLEEFGDLAEPA